MTKKLFQIQILQIQVFHNFLWKTSNKGRTYDSTIEFRHCILEVPNIGRNLYKGIYSTMS